MTATSDYLNLPIRSESDIRARRAQLASDMRAEGSSEAFIAKVCNDDTVAKILAHEDQCVGAIMRLIGGRL